MNTNIHTLNEQNMITLDGKEVTLIDYFNPSGLNHGGLYEVQLEEGAVLVPSEDLVFTQYEDLPVNLEDTPFFQGISISHIYIPGRG